jgi:hypothetical protein
MHVFRIPDPYYRAKIFLAVNGSADEISKYCKRYFKSTGDPGIDNSDGGAILTLDYETGKRYILWLAEWKPKTEFLADMGHEILHLVNQVLDERGMKPKAYNDEAHAYFFGYLMKTMLDKLTTLKKGNK